MWSILILLVKLFYHVMSMSSTSSPRAISLNCTTSNWNSVLNISCFLPTINEKHIFISYESSDVQSATLTCTDLNSRSELSYATFIGMTKLKSLALVNCKIDYLRQDAIGNIDGRLQQLTITGTYLPSNINYGSQQEMTISSQSFSQHVFLQELSLYNNRLYKPPSNEYCQLMNLKVLNLSANAFDDVQKLGFGHSNDVPNKTCATQLAVLDLSFNNLTTLLNSSFSLLINLKTLYLNHNKIQQVDINAFFKLERHLQFLDVSNNYHYRVVEVVQWTNLGYPDRLRNAFWKLDLGGSDPSRITIADNLYRLSSFDYRYNDNFNSDIIDAMNELISTGQYQIKYQGINSEAVESMYNLVNLLELTLDRNVILQLKENTFIGLTRLKKLSISRNQLSSFSKDIFNGLENLEELDLESNDIGEIQDGVFLHLSNLKVLVLDLNHVSNISAGAFSGLRNLKSLYLYLNQIKVIHKDTLSPLTALQILKVGFNSITNFTSLGHRFNITDLDLSLNDLQAINSKLFHDLPELTVLNLAYNQLESLPEELFDNAAKLSILDLRKNNLIEIPKQGIQALHRHNSLIELDISYNRIRVLDTEYLPTSLVRLAAIGNSIKDLPENAFTTLINLEELDIQNNILQRIRSNAFPSNISLINLSNNQISSIEPFAFRDLNYLKSVELNDNKLVTLDASVLMTTTKITSTKVTLSGNQFICDCTLEWINFLNNNRPQNSITDYDRLTCCVDRIQQDNHCSSKKIKDMNLDDFRCYFQSYHLTPPTFCVNLTDNRTFCNLVCPVDIGCQCYHRYNWTTITTSCSYLNLDSVPKKISSSSTEIQLDGNDITELSSFSFQSSYPALTRLQLNDSKIKIISEFTFESMNGLVELYLQLNRLISLKRNTFAGLKQLKLLLLYSNNLLYLDPELFKPLSSLTELSIRDNQLQQLPDFDSKNNPKLSNVDLVDNPWNCTCKNFVKFNRLETSGMYKNTSSENGVRCHYTDSLKQPSRLFQEFGAVMCALDPAASWNSASLVLPLAITTVIFVVIIVLCAVIFNYRHEIRVIIYSRYGIRLRYGRRPPEGTAEDDGKLYDAFVAYSNDDVDFVAHELVARLEGGDRPYVLCLHQRNFAVGSYIMESILEAIECSRRTIVVMSRNFLESSWCRFEFKSAHHHMLQDQRSRLIMIVLDDDAVEMDTEPNIKIYLKTNTYLSRSDKLFWEKLYYAMPDRRVPTYRAPESVI